METNLFILQTWAAYAFLFQHWSEHPGSEHPEVEGFRQKIQMVAGMIPETGRKEYLKRLQEKAWDLFRDHVYDEAEPGDLNAFSFDLTDQEAPHYPPQHHHDLTALVFVLLDQLPQAPVIRFVVFLCGEGDRSPSGLTEYWRSALACTSWCRVTPSNSNTRRLTCALEDLDGHRTPFGSAQKTVDNLRAAFPAVAAVTVPGKIHGLVKLPLVLNLNTKLPGETGGCALISEPTRGGKLGAQVVDPCNDHGDSQAALHRGL